MDNNYVYKKLYFKLAGQLSNIIDILEEKAELLKCVQRDCENILLDSTDEQNN